MSISSLTATTLPHSPHFGYHDHPTYNAHPGQYANHSLPNGSSRLAPSQSHQGHNTPPVPRTSNYSAQARHLPIPTAMPNPQSTRSVQPSQKRRRSPDWEDFYKNGLPKEIILIDDDTPDRESAPRQSKRKENQRGVQNSSVRPRGAGAPAPKKRRTAQTAHDHIRDQHYGSYSNARTYSHGDSGSNTISTDRTTSLQTTAPTSLGSHTSHGSSGAYAEDAAVSQKRKRVTRKQIADEKKQKEVNVVDPYIPPPKPPIKAKDVHVPTIRDVCQPYTSSVPR